MTEKDEPKRIDVPLRMIEGNIDVMLEHKIPCNSISFRWAEDTVVPTLLLQIEASAFQRVEHKALGFVTVKSPKEGE